MVTKKFKVLLLNTMGSLKKYVTEKTAILNSSESEKEKHSTKYFRRYVTKVT